ncbi:Uncharacterized protein Adt_21490 [Abeliophyllum distichum]|uniref:Uncharacterized protein n=1 Tax=Abeliophyllum distichum TaxID=126358 RepID=A0ABD1SZH8_9LAMI
MAPSPAPTLKVVQTKISLKAKSLLPAKGVVIREPSPNPGRPTAIEMEGKGKEKFVEPPPKVKPTSSQLLSFSETTKPGSSSREKRQLSNSRSSLAKKQRTSSSSGPHSRAILESLEGFVVFWMAAVGWLVGMLRIENESGSMECLVPESSSSSSPSPSVGRER